MMLGTVGAFLYPFLLGMAPRGLIIVLCFIAVAIFVSVDYYSGILKARENKIPITSDNMRRTIIKGVNYLLVMLGASFVDLIQMLAIFIINFEHGRNIITIPIATIIMTLFNCYVEYTSIKEAASIKQKKLEALAKKDLKEFVKLYKQLKQDGILGEQE